MKKLLTIFSLITMSFMIIFTMSSCGNNNEEYQGEKITITALDKDSKETEVTVPLNPSRIAVIDMAALDIIVNLGLESRIVCVASTSLSYLKDAVSGIKTCGTIKNPDCETIMEKEPDIIFMGGRGGDYFSTLNEIAPVVRLTVTGDVIEGTMNNAKTIARIFNLEEKINEKIQSYDERINALKEFASGKNAIVGLCTSGSFNVLGNDGRCSIIGNELGFSNIGLDYEEYTSTHGNSVSFEYIVSKDPEYIFVMDRDAAIGTEGAKLASEIMDNELIRGTNCYKNGNLIILDNPGVWYTAEGGFTALGIMLSDLETKLFKN